MTMQYRDFRKKELRIGPYTIISQHPNVISDAALKISVDKYLPQFLAFWKDLERATGHRWKSTSYIRDSPSHRPGQAFDLAPDIAEHASSHYAVSNGSDPVLYKRSVLIQQLQTLTHNDYSGDGSNKLGVFIEPDHLHLQILQPKAGPNGVGETPTPIVKWEIPKPVYSDTYERMGLPKFI